MESNSSWADILLDRPPSGMIPILDTQIPRSVKIVHVVHNVCCGLDGYRAQVPGFTKPLGQFRDDKVIRLLLDCSVRGKVVTFGFVVAKGVDAVAKEAKDVFEDVRIGVDEEGTVGLLVVVPASRVDVAEVIAAGQ